MQKQNKVWGITTELLITPFMELHRIGIKPSSYCSKHIHKFKSNSFYCVKGSVVVRVWKDNGLIDETVLGPGDITTVLPGESHMFETRKLSEIQAVDPTFQAGELVDVFEVYYPSPIDKLDIQRETIGGSLYST